MQCQERRKQQNHVSSSLRSSLRSSPRSSPTNATISVNLFARRSTKPRGGLLWDLFKRGVLKEGANEVKYENNYLKKGRTKTRFAR